MSSPTTYDVILFPNNSSPSFSPLSHDTFVNNNDECPICGEDTSAAIIKTSCGHVFHEECMSTWLLELQDQDRQGLCPMCRHTFITEVTWTMMQDFFEGLAWFETDADGNTHLVRYEIESVEVGLEDEGDVEDDPDTFWPRYNGNSELNDEFSEEDSVCFSDEAYSIDDGEDDSRGDEGFCAERFPWLFFPIPE